MKKLLLPLLTTATIITSASASDDVYVGGGLALQDAGLYDTGMSLVLNGGVSLSDVEVQDGNIGLETELTYTIVSPSVGNVDAEAMTLAGYATYFNNISSQLYTKARLGLAYVSPDNAFADDTIAPSAGLGLGYKHDESMNFYVDYTFLTSSLANMTFGIQFKIQ
jgi:hypothetical protein